MILAHCHACARPTEARNYDNVRACCSDCLTPYRDDAAVWEVPPVVGPNGKTEWTAPCAHCGMSFDAADNPFGGHACRGCPKPPAAYSEMERRLQERLDSWNEITVAAVDNERRHWLKIHESAGRRIAWALFCLETMAEVTRIAEGQGTEHEVRLVMWARTRTEIRDRCLARAAEIANWMVHDPEETP